VKRVAFSQQWIVLAIFIIAFTVFTFALPGFASVGNILSLLRSVSVLGVLGLGMGIVVIGRGIDLSMIAVMVVPPGVFLQMMAAGAAPGVALVATIGIALALGLLNGLLIALAEIPPLFATLATGVFLWGVGQAFLFPLDVIAWPTSAGSISFIGTGSVLGLPTTVCVFGVTAIAVGFLLARTKFGRFVYAVGSNPLAARTTGMPVRAVVLTEYVVAALISSLAGILLAASVTSLNTRIFNSTMIYDVILVVVLGGIGLSGGRGGVLNVIVGTLLIGTLANGMTIMDFSYSTQSLIRGGILLAAIAIDSIINPRNEETAQQGDI
jgi:ribose transport system permease protein